MADTSLEQQLKRLMLLRLVMITTLLLIGVYVEAVSEELLRVNPLYFVIVGTYVLTVLHALALRFVGPALPLVYAQVVGDLATITALVYFFSGIRAGFIILYPISVLSGAVLLYRRGALVLAGVATLFYAAILWVVRAELIPAQGLSDVPFLGLKALLYSIFVTGVSCVTVALIGSYLAESLKSVGAQLEEVAEQVADLQELNQVIVKSIHGGLLTADTQGRVLYLNDFGAAMLGRRLGDLRGRPIREVFGSRLLEPGALHARASSQELDRFEITYQPPEGGPRTIGISVSPLATGSGGYLLAFQDLTDVKRLEEDVRIKEKLAAVGEMAAQLAHEIRNPLGSISGSAQVLLGERNMSPEQEHLLSIITRESKRLSGALNQFLVEVRPSTRPHGPVDLQGLVQEAVLLLRNSPEVSPEHRVDFEWGAGPHLARADPDRILQVFWNLARNGLEAMPDGGVLRVRLDREPDEVVLSVRDTGRGLAEERRHFAPVQPRVGTGLGLAIVYRIVREHGGDISMRSIAPRGTEVYVRLPALRVPDGEPPIHPRPDPADKI